MLVVRFSAWNSPCSPVQITPKLDAGLTALILRDDQNTTLSPCRCRSLLKIVEPALHFQSWMLIFRDRFGQIPLRCFVRRLVRKVGPFVGVDSMVIEFFAAIFITNVTPAFGSN